MLKKLNLKLLSSVASVITLAAFTGVGTRCLWITYEPDVPECLKK